MILQHLFRKPLAVYHDYPRGFWIMIAVNFVDRLGGSLLFPFFGLYITRRFGVGMTEVGVLFAVFSVASFVGAFPGGALTDRFGRKKLIIFSLIATSLGSVALGFVNSMSLFFVVGFLTGVLTDAGSPAYNAIFADLLPEEKRISGFGILRVAFNLASVFGPVIGGFLAARSYTVLFITDAVISLIAAGIVIFAVAETRPAGRPDIGEETTVQSFGGYLRVLRNSPFMLFVLFSTLSALVYMNMNTTLGVFLRDHHGVPESGYGWILSLNAAMVVFLQFPITRAIGKYPPMLMMALGTLLYGVGFGIYGFASNYALFLLAMAVITIGEMIDSPVGTALVARFSPEDMRGRYSFIYGLSWGIGFAAGPYLAGLVLDNMNPNLLWYAAGLVATLSALGFLSLNGRVKAESSAIPGSEANQPVDPLPVVALGEGRD